jgi:hypothetical protein
MDGLAAGKISSIIQYCQTFSNHGETTRLHAPTAAPTERPSNAYGIPNLLGSKSPMEHGFRRKIKIAVSPIQRMITLPDGML